MTRRSVLANFEAGDITKEKSEPDRSYDVASKWELWI